MYPLYMYIKVKISEFFSKNITLPTQLFDQNANKDNVRIN